MSTTAIVELIVLIAIIVGGTLWKRSTSKRVKDIDGLSEMTVVTKKQLGKTLNEDVLSEDVMNK